MAVLPPLWLLVIISALGPIVMNGVLPASSQVMRDLQTDYGAAQLVLTMYLVATMFAQVILGNWADRYGRRPVMIGGLLVFAVGGLICALSPSIEILLAGRFVQGFGSSVCTFLPRTVVRDVFSRDRAASVIGYMTTAMMVAPLFGPALGGWVTDVSTWRWLYAGLAIAGASFSLLSYRYLNETMLQLQVRPVGSRLLDSSKVLLRTKLFRAYLAVLCGSVGVYYCFLGGAPYVLMELRGLSASSYGLWFMMVATGYLLGNLVAGRFSERVGTDRMIAFSMIPLVSGTLSFWLFSQWHHPLALFIPMQMVAFSNGMCLPNVMSATMSVNTDLAGSASGLSGTVQTAVGILFTLLLSVFLNESAYPMFLLITISATLSVIGFLQIRKS